MKATDLASRRDKQSRQPLYRPAEVAKTLGCSEWWVKEQARNRRIPFSWIGGSYRFTDDHVAEIIQLFEVRPTEPGASSSATSSASRPRTPRVAEPVTRLTARPPRRALRSGAPSTNAA